MNTIKKYFGYVLSFVALVGLTVSNYAHAAADTYLSSGLASTTLIFTDNYGVVISWVVGIFAITIVVGLVIKALFFGKRQALGMLGGGKRRR